MKLPLATDLISQAMITLKEKKVGVRTKKAEDQEI
jgi:hypothetical protein